MKNTIPIKIEGKFSTRLDPDELQEEKKIGEGKFGVVVKGIFRENVVVIKKFKNIDDDGSLDEFEKEVSMLDKFRSDYIIHFYGSSFITNRIIMVTEFAEYGSLQDLIKKKKNQPLQKKMRIKILLDSAKGIQYLHSNDILHRDIKPSNIFLMKDNTIKLGDFGISKDIHIFHYTRTQGAGTPLYMAPEIILKKKYDLKVDVWSLGVTFCHLMTLHFPFELKKNDPDHPDHKYENILNGIKSNKITECNGNYKKEINEKYSQEFLNLIDEMMTIDPQKRPNIGDILNKDIIKKRMSSFLKENKFNSDEANKIIESYEKEKEKEKENMQNYKEFEINEKTQKINIEDSSLENNNDYSELNTLEITPQKENRLKYNFQRILSLVHKEQISRRKTMNN